MSENVETTKLYAEETEKTMIQFSEMVADDLEEYRINNEVLQNAVRSAYIEQQEFNRQVDRHDYGKLAIRKPRALERVINRQFERLHDKICQVTGCENASSADLASATKAATGDTVTSQD